MSDEIKKQVITLEDGRRAERIVQEENTECEGKVVTELWVEPAIEKRLSQRVVEYKKPVVHRREVEFVDETSGEVIERKVESIEPEVKMQLREVIKTESSVKAQSVAEQPCDCFVTQEDMQQTFKEGFMAVAKALKSSEERVQSQSYYEEEKPKVSAMQIMVGDRVKEAEENGGMDTVGAILWTVIAGLAATFVYIAFFM